MHYAIYLLSLLSLWSCVSPGRYLDAPCQRAPLAAWGAHGLCQIALWCNARCLSFSRSCWIMYWSSWAWC